MTEVMDNAMNAEFQALLADQQKLDAVVNVLGIEDSHDEPADVIVAMLETEAKLRGEIAELKRHLQSTWRWRYLAEARLSVLKMCLTNDRVRRGHTGKAWDGKFLSDMLEAVADSEAEPCMDCGGTGTEVDPETGPGMCPCCSGFGVLPAEGKS